MTFRADIQGLRGLAILLVVAYHARLSFASGGFVGVDVFFVLSGYLITGLLFKELSATGTVKLRDFYARRARRLLPASSFVLVTTVLVAVLLLSPLEQLTLAPSAIATALYVSNLFFIRQSTDYLASPPDENPFLHTWSLAVEEQFYLVWPTLILVLSKILRSRRACALGMGVVTLGSFALNVWLTGFAQPWAFFGSPARMWEFSIGGMAAVLPVAAASRRLFYECACAAGLAMIIVAAVGFDQTTTFPSVAALLPVIGSTLLVAFGGNSALIASSIQTRPMVWLGDVSYVWYLWHWPARVFAEALVPDLGVRGRVVCGAVSLLIAAASRKLLEDRARFSPWLTARPLTTLALAVLVTMVTVGSSTMWRSSALAASASEPHKRFTQARDDNPIVYADGCHLDYTQVSSPECAFGDTDSDVTIVLFGDSHAAQWFPALETFAKADHLRLVSLTKSGCPSVDVGIRDLSLGRRYKECEEWRHNSMVRIKEIEPALVVLANSSHYFRPSPLARSEAVPTTVNKGARELPIASTSADWLAGLERTLHSLEDMHVHTIILRDSPRPGFDGPTCLARLAWRPWLYRDCQFRRDRAIRQDVADAEDIAARTSQRVSIVDISSAICKSEECDIEKGDLVIYRDYHHLTASFSASLAPSLAELLRRER